MGWLIEETFVGFIVGFERNATAGDRTMSDIIIYSRIL